MIYTNHTMRTISKFRIIAETTDIESNILNCPLDIANYVRPFFDDVEVQEQSFLLFLNTCFRVNGYTHLSIGRINSTPVDIRILAKILCNQMSVNVVFCHNHPSGSLVPSNSDKLLNKKISKICKLFEINFLDSIIITKTDFYSLTSNYEMP